MRKRGVTLFEILVASVMLVLIVGGTSVSIASMKRLSAKISYRFSALDLARDVMEFGEDIPVTHGYSLKYAYDPSYSQYRVTESTNYNPATDESPFASGRMGDIKSKGYVPRNDPEGVEITYKVVSEPAYYYQYVQTVKVSWREAPSEPRQQLVLGGMAIVPLNNQLGLDIREQTWN